MHQGKHIKIVTAALAGFGLVVNMIMLFVSGTVAMSVGICAGVVGFVSLCVLTGKNLKDSSAIEVAVRVLNEEEFNESNLKKQAKSNVLLRSVYDFVSSFGSKIKELEKKGKECGLQLQLQQKEKHSVEAILYSINDAVVVSDDFDRVVLANEAAGDLLGFDPAASYLKDIHEVIKDAALVDLVVKSRAGNIKHVKHEISFDNEQGISTHDCVVSCVYDDKGMVSGVVAVLHDVTREKEVSQMKNDFVSHVSHELKTPLASINAYAEMLVDGEAEDQETVKEFCTIIQGQAQRLNRLIEEILNISRIESGLIKVNKEPLSVAILIQESAQMIASYAAEKNISVSVPAPIIYGQVEADRDMLSQVIINLLSNAVKYTAANGSVTVDCQVDDADGLMRVTVADTGVGIPPDDVDHVFDKFYRVEANKKYAKGTGLGLNLVEQIVNKVHGGRVFVTSEVGKGSTFGFELPMAVREGAAV
ncbi:MAG: PAS domain-containing protein [Anaerohalosphaera sp.]|nr:PAS domain-containing protein [Anaerohalosphaera sp.]